MSFQNLLSNQLIKEGEEIKSILDKMVKCDDTKFKAIPYDLGILLMNNSLTEIQGLINEANKKGLNNEEISEFVLNQFALTLPQDIIINMKINGLLENKDKSFKKIIELYNKGEHSNFTNFLKTMNNYKNIIYTFSSNLEILKNIYDINNELIGTISKENIKQIIISSIKSENELEKELDSFFNEDNYKICLLKLMPYEGILMNYLKYFIENKEKNLDDENNSKKIFIFIFCMKRVMKKDLKSINKMLLKEQIEIRKNIIENTLSHLSGYYQIVIDNLNGDENLRIEKIINMKQTELFNTLINLDEELGKNILKCISYMNYNIIAEYKWLNKDNYAEILFNFIHNNKRLRTLINKCIFSKSINKNEDIIIKIFQDKNLFGKIGIEIISFIKKYLLKFYFSQLYLLYNKAEKEQFFSSLLSNSLEQKIWQSEINNIKGKNGKISNNFTKEYIFEDKTITEKIAKLYLEDIIYNNGLTTIIKKPVFKKINIILGLKIPGIKIAFDEVIKSVNDNLLENYRKNENNLRIFYENEDERKKK